MKRCRGGPEVAAAIVYHEGLWRAFINGQWCDAGAPDPVNAAGVFDIWTGGRMIDEARFRQLRANPPADPYKPVDLLTMPSIF